MEWNRENDNGHSLKCSLLEGFITRRKVAESSAQLSCLSYAKASLSLFQNECPLRMLAFAASGVPKLTNKIGYPEQNRVGKKPMVTVLTVKCYKA